MSIKSTSHNTTSTACILSALLLSATANGALVNYVVTGYAMGSSAIVDKGIDGTTDVSGANAGGGPTNTILVPAGPNTFVDFTIGDANAIVGDPFLATNINALPTVATLRVTLQAVSTGGTEVMIARTSNSQGLTDIGTVSLLLTGRNGLNSNTQENSATFRFEWRNIQNNGPLGGNNSIIFSSYDIDYTQRNRINTADYKRLETSVDHTNLTITTVSGITSVVDLGPGTDSVSNNPTNSYYFETVDGDNNQVITVDKVGGGVVANGFGKGGNQLYMFSFRNTSPLISIIPEPSSVMVASLGLFVLLRRRRA